MNAEEYITEAWKIRQDLQAHRAQELRTNRFNEMMDHFEVLKKICGPEDRAVGSVLHAIQSNISLEYSDQDRCWQFRLSPDAAKLLFEACQVKMLPKTIERLLPTIIHKRDNQYTTWWPLHEDPTKYQEHQNTEAEARYWNRRRPDWSSKALPASNEDDNTPDPPF